MSVNFLRRGMLLAGLAGLPGARALPRRRLSFPRDHGAHPDLRTEWWYVTGHARAGTQAAAREFGFQVTFFRSRVDAAQAMASAFSAKQLVFAHAAISDVQGRKLWHDQRIAREGFGVAAAQIADAGLVLRDWSLARRPANDTWQARVTGQGFSLDLRFEPTQPLLLQGDQGLSRKGPDLAQASYYYSLPQLATRGRIGIKGQLFDVTGQAWLDHEWSETLLHSDAVGWDWIGMNLLDGAALTAFRLRARDGRTLWDGGSFRAPSGAVQPFGPGEVVFSPRRSWTSPASRATYPVEWSVRTPTGTFTVRPVFDPQELDSRASTGAVYWEGLCGLYDATGRLAGRGYLEMTGYAQALRM